MIVELPTVITTHLPKSPDFISELSHDVIKKLKKLGWNIEKTIFLKVPYVLAFVNTHEPAVAGNFIVPVFNKGTYFRTLVLSAKTENEPELDLEDTILHEMKELSEQEAYLTTHGLYRERTDSGYLAEEVSILESTSREISKKHGFSDNGLVIKAQVDAALRAFKIRDEVGTIGNQTVFILLCEYLEKNYARYSADAIPLTPIMIAMENEFIKKEIERQKSFLLSSPDKMLVSTFTYVGEIEQS